MTVPHIKQKEREKTPPPFPPFLFLVRTVQKRILFGLQTHNFWDPNFFDLFYFFLQTLWVLTLVTSFCSSNTYMQPQVCSSKPQVCSSKVCQMPWKAIHVIHHCLNERFIMAHVNWSIMHMYEIKPLPLSMVNIPWGGHDWL